MILPQVGLKQAKLAAEKLRAAVEGLKPFASESGQERKITISIGVSSFPECTNLREELIKFADEALYKAKERGRNRVEFAPAKDVLVEREL